MVWLDFSLSFTELIIKIKAKNNWFLKTKEVLEWNEWNFLFNSMVLFQGDWLLTTDWGQALQEDTKNMFIIF